ncbi:hypothetical protein KCP69_21975 [Salmonella enterica subsp. enterica]|nr:hypothetical protein KCP69_21975 [Salmonella enterica subsp. enterica]
MSWPFARPRPCRFPGFFPAPQNGLVCHIQQNIAEIWRCAARERHPDHSSIGLSVDTHASSVSDITRQFPCMVMALYGLSASLLSNPRPCHQEARMPSLQSYRRRGIVDMGRARVFCVPSVLVARHPAQCLQQFVFAASTLQSTSAMHYAISSPRRLPNIPNTFWDPADTLPLSLLFPKNGRAGDFIRPEQCWRAGRLCGGRHRRRVTIACGPLRHNSKTSGIAPGHTIMLFDVLWHMFKFPSRFGIQLEPALPTAELCRRCLPDTSLSPTIRVSLASSAQYRPVISRFSACKSG